MIEEHSVVEEMAEEMGLTYSTDISKGITRLYEKGSAVYRNLKAEIIENQATLDRIKSLKIPPAWIDVWISPSAKGHLQAIGFDAKERKQYIYHPDWNRLRCESKFDKMQHFGTVLPSIRKQVEKDLAIKKLTKQKMLATVVGLLDHTLIRIGNRMYEKQNHSYGLTTLRNKHMKAIGKNIAFEFIGKKGVKQSVKVTDSKLARIVKKCKDIPGYHLFQFYDSEGLKHDLNSHDVNEYLKDITGEEITAKDFRTWGGSCHAIKLLQQLEVSTNEKELKKTINEVVRSMASKLGNTISVCKKHYLHPLVLEAYKDKEIHQFVEKNPNFHLKGSKMLLPEEKIFLRIITN
jgi:DNA topoisomerase-1